MKWIAIIIAVVCINAQAREQTSAFGYLTNLVSYNDMEPALQVGDRVASDPDHYKNNDIKRGNIVLIISLKKDGTNWVKRVVGLPGELVESNKGKIYINGTELVEPYVEETNNQGISLSLKKAHKVPENHFYVLGDNRDNSMDSRFLGPVSRENRS